MTNSYYRLVELIGKPLDSREVQQCLVEIGISKCHQHRDSKHYESEERGITLFFMKDELEAFFLHFCTAAVQAGSVKPFSGELPGGLKLGDKRDDVRRKLGMAPEDENRIQGRAPEEEKDYWDEYKIGKMRFTSICKGDDQRLSSIAVRKWEYRPPKWLRELSQAVQQLLSSFEQTESSRMTKGTARIFARAWDEAERSQQTFIGTEHILLALVSDKGSIGETFKQLGVTIERAREVAERITGAGKTPSPVGFTPAVRNLLKYAREEASESGHARIQVEHLVLAITNKSSGAAARMLEVMEVDASVLRQKMHNLLQAET